MILPSDISPLITSEDLGRLIDEYAEPFETVAQCNVYLRAAAIYRRRTPEEAQNEQQTFRLRDIQAGVEEARRMKGVLAMTGETAEAIVPQDRLR